ncbi:translation initiation factor eIF3 subunit 135-domain-containing protein [Fimicolochytrium jonesii]|uniref:translation initiation factor eIF3 subunit 135-domain-containing protein n=1 Tax=Fimicolochytrium jonesii TaxID=1396493 RepID=UPI0022FE7391|nr:translation initiation factor eIF3 subunit 135-domain-containing protein [Fimicolochytrium jonesii]KAI8816801.1 translation initiation factor eIF3 subunit 135-domain-containing protein [Fimicolochytrium jonesii]
MLAVDSATPANSLPLKQGWVLKKGGSGFLAHWRLKYLVLVGSPDSYGSPMKLLVYDQVDQSRPPKHEIALRDASVDELAGPKVASVKKGAAPFLIVDKKRKFYFAAQTRGDRDDWFAILKPAPLKPRHPSAAGQRRATISGRNHSSRPGLSPTLRRSNSSLRYRSFSCQRDDDAMSTCSFETSASGMDPMDNSDAVSVYSIASSRGNSSTLDDGRSSVASSRFETLSFCSEPVLTPQELTLMGNSSAVSSSYRHEEGFTFRDAFRRRRAPISQPEAYLETQQPACGEAWNERYQAVLSTRCETEEAALQQDIQLQEVIGQFQETAQQIAKRMIDDYHLQLSSGKNGSVTRPVTPHNSGMESMSSLDAFTQCLNIGKHGEVVQDGIILRFASNYDEATPEQVQLIHRQTSSELVAIDALTRASFASHSTPHLHTVLMVLIDYKGFRVVAYADMGDRETERAMSVHDLSRDPPRTDERALERLMSVGQALNLKSHVVRVGDERRIACALAKDVEVHFNPASKIYYASNLHKILPADHHPAQDNNSIANHPLFSRVLRPEFFSIYEHPLTPDAFTMSSGATRRERETNDGEVARAVKHLREVVVPAFVARLDALDVRVVDSRGLVGEMHSAGINVRYLGHIARQSTLPYIRSFAQAEMCARAFKSLFQARMRAAIVHFKSVGATSIDEEMKAYAVGMFGTLLGAEEKGRKFFQERLKEEILRKFDYLLEWSAFVQLHKPALFLAMQHHCGVVFEDTTDYDFTSPTPIPRTSFSHFAARIKQPAGLARLRQPSTPDRTTGPSEDDRLAYHLARHFKSLGPRSKLARLEGSAAALSQIAAHYNATKRYEEARLYAQASLSAAARNSCLAGLAMGILIEAIAAGGSGSAFAPTAGKLAKEDEDRVMELYRQAVEVALWHCGDNHPAVMGLHDKVAGVFERLGKLDRAVEFYGSSLRVAEKTLGKNHLVTAGYLVKMGTLSQQLQNPTDACQHFTDALHLYQGLSAPLPLVAHLHHHFALPLADRGDLDAAITHAQRARRMFEKTFGQADPRTVETYRLVAKLVLTPYARYEGVLTPVIRAAYKEAVGCYEKIFRFVKSATSSSSSSRSSTAGGSSASSSTSSLTSTTPRRPPTLAPLIPPAPAATHPPPPPLLGTTSFPTPISGPLITPTALHSLPTHPRSLLHTLTRQIISLKLRLIESPQHREIVRMLRANNKDRVLSAHEARGVVLRLAAISPSVYLDGVLGRIEEGDRSAVEELGCVLGLTEGEVVGVDA